MLTTHPPAQSINVSKEIGTSSVLGYICKGCISRILKEKFTNPTESKKDDGGDNGMSPPGGDNKDFSPESENDNDTPVTNFSKLTNFKLNPLPINNNNNQSGLPRCLICGAKLKLVPSDGLTLKTSTGQVGSNNQNFPQKLGPQPDPVANMKRDFAVSMINCPMCDRKSLRAVEATMVGHDKFDHRHLIGGDSMVQGLSQSSEVNDMLKKLERCERSTYLDKDGTITKSMIMAQEDRLFSPIPVKVINPHPDSNFVNPSYLGSMLTKSPVRPTDVGVCPKCHLPLGRFNANPNIPRPLSQGPLTIPTILATQVNQIKSIMKTMTPVMPGQALGSQWNRPGMMGDSKHVSYPIPLVKRAASLPIQQFPQANMLRSPNIQPLVRLSNTFGPVQPTKPVSFAAQPCPQISRCCPTCHVPFTPVPSIVSPIVNPPNPGNLILINRGPSPQLFNANLGSRCRGCGQPNAPQQTGPQVRVCGMCGKPYQTSFTSRPSPVNITPCIIRSNLPVVQQQQQQIPVGICKTCGQPLPFQNTCSFRPVMDATSCRCALCGQSMKDDNAKVTINGSPKGPVSSWNVCAACQRHTYTYPNGYAPMMAPRYNAIQSMSINPQIYYPNAQRSINIRPLYPVLNTLPISNAVGYAGSFASLPMGRALAVAQPSYTLAYFHIEELAKLLVHMIDLLNPRHPKKSIDEIIERCRIYFEGIIEFKETRDTNSRLDFNKGILKGDTNAMMLNTLRDRLKEKDKFVYRKVDPKSEFERTVEKLLSWYAANPAIPKADAIKHAKQIYDNMGDKDKDMARIANEVLKDLNIRADAVPEILRLLRSCLKNHSDLSAKDIVELTYLTYDNVMQSKGQGRAIQTTKSIHKSINGTANIPIEYESEIVKNVCILQGKYPFVSPRTVMFYSLDMYKSFLEGPLPQLSSHLGGSVNQKDPLLHSLDDLKGAIKSLKDNVDRFKDFMQVLDQKGELAKISIKSYDKSGPAPQPQSIMKNSNSSVDKEYILEYFRNRLPSKASFDSKSSIKTASTYTNDYDSTDGSLKRKEKKKSNLKKTKSGI